jgi:hypothetical protein
MSKQTDKKIDEKHACHGTLWMGVCSPFLSVVALISDPHISPQEALVILTAVLTPFQPGMGAEHFARKRCSCRMATAFSMSNPEI